MASQEERGPRRKVIEDPLGVEPAATAGTGTGEPGELTAAAGTPPVIPLDDEADDVEMITDPDLMRTDPDRQAVQPAGSADFGDLAAGLEGFSDQPQKFQGPQRPRRPDVRAKKPEPQFTAQERKRAKDVASAVETKIKELLLERPEEERPEDVRDWSLPEIVAQLKEAYFHTNQQSPRDYEESRRRIRFLSEQVLAAEGGFREARGSYDRFVAAKSNAGEIRIQTPVGRRNLEYVVVTQQDRKLYRVIERAAKDMLEWFSSHVKEVEQAITDAARRTGATQPITDLIAFIDQGMDAVPDEIKQIIGRLYSDQLAIGEFIDAHMTEAAEAGIDLNIQKKRLTRILGDPIAAVTDPTAQPIDGYTNELTRGRGLEATIRTLRSMGQPRQWKRGETWNQDRQNPVDHARDRVAELYTPALTQQLDEVIARQKMSPDQEYGFWLWWLDKADDTVDRKQFRKTSERGAAVREQLGMIVEKAGRRVFNTEVIIAFMRESVEQCRYIGDLRNVMRPLGGMLGLDVRKELHEALAKFSTEDKLRYAEQIKKAVQVEQIGLLKKQPKSIEELMQAVHSQAMATEETPVKFTAVDVMSSIFGDGWAKQDLKVLTSKFIKGKQLFERNIGRVIKQAGKTNEDLRRRLQIELIEQIGIGRRAGDTASNTVLINGERIQRIVANLTEGATQKTIFDYSRTGETSAAGQAVQAEYQGQIEHIFSAHEGLAQAVLEVINNPEAEITGQQREAILARFRQLQAVYRDSKVDWAVEIGLVGVEPTGAVEVPEPKFTVNTERVAEVVGDLMESDVTSINNDFALAPQQLALAVSEPTAFGGLSSRLQELGADDHAVLLFTQMLVEAALHSSIATAPQAEYSLAKAVDLTLNRLEAAHTPREPFAVTLRKVELMSGNKIDMSALVLFMDNAYLDEENSDEAGDPAGDESAAEA